MRDYFNFRRAMALLTVALVMSLLPTSASAQSWNKRISIHLKSVDISEFFKAINEKSGLEFISSYAEIKHSPKVSVDESDTPVRTILDKVLKPLGFSYQISDGVLSVHGRKPAKDMRLFSGTLRDVEGQPLPGAHVHVVGTKLYTIADGDGNFAIDIPTAETRIEYSFVGMRKKVSIVKAGNSDEYRDVELKYDTDIDEVVVTGYQDFDKNRMAGSVGQISAKDLTLNGFNSVEQALQGKLAGVAVTNVSGMVGRTAKTRVRGTSTMFGSQEPIWVVDGVIQEDPLPFSTQTLDAQGGITESNFDYIRNFVGNSISWLNPMDIDRITVLKDASATAIYGTKAANGVIVINTKRGKVGSLAVSYSGGMQIGQRLSHKAEEMMNSKERVDVSREIFQRGLTASWSNNNIGYAGVLQDYLFGRITAQEFETQVAKLETNNTDWFDLLFRNPVSQNHSVSLSGGSEMARFYASMSYNQTNGTAIGNDQNSYSAHVGLNMDFSKKFRVSVDVSGNRSKTNGFYKFDAYTYAHNVNRAIPAYNEDGTLFYYQNRSLKTGSSGGGYLYNALNERDNTGNQNVNLSFNTSVNAYYDISKDFQFNSLFSVNASSVKGESWATERSNYIADKRGYDYGEVLPTDSKYKLSGLPVGGELNTSNTNQTTWSWRNSLQFDHVYNKVHAVTAMLGMEMSSTRYKGYSDTRYGYLPERGKSFAQLPATVTNPYSNSAQANPLYENYAGPTITDTKTNNMGLYLTLNYAYDNRYVANMSVRGDASNRFGQYHNEKFNPVWAGGLRWNVDREKWFHEQDIVSDLSVRASWGYQRNMASNFSPSLIVKIPTGAASNITDMRTGDYLLTISNLPYNDLRWEKTFSQNYGVDFGLFESKVRLSFEYYTKKATDLITTLNIPYEYGMETMPVNGGSMKNSGYELTVGFTPVRTKNFTWNVSLNTSKDFNEVTKVGLQSQSYSYVTSGNFYKKGYAASSFWAFKYDGVDPKTGYPIIDLSMADNLTAEEKKDPTNFMVYAGKIDPDFTGGISMGFRYKDLSLNTSLYLRVGGKTFLQSAYQSTYLPSEFENLTNELVNRWTPENTNSSLPGLPDINVKSQQLPNGEYATVYQMYNYSTDRIASTTSLACNNLGLSYSVPYKWVKRHLRLQSLSIGASVTNLFIIHTGDFKGRDPEVAMGQQPRTRSLSLNLNVAF